MNFALCSSTDAVPFSAVEAMAGAIGKQLVEVAAAWGRVPSTIEAVPYAETASAGSRLVMISADPPADEQGILGVHLADGSANVYAAPILNNGGSLLAGPSSVSVTASHECCEDDGDPPASYWAQMPDGRFVALELGDPVEGDAYEINDVSVSNFILPAWFDAAAKGPYDRLGKLSAPFTMTAGGYLIIAAAGAVTNVFGEQMPGWRRYAKSHHGTRGARRIARTLAAPGAASR